MTLKPFYPATLIPFSGFLYAPYKLLTIPQL